jgi:predicted RNA binding protein YcfA (HicA-like mRNA interferase family)
MKVRDIIKMLEEDGWYSVKAKGAIVSLSTPASQGE